MHKDKHLYVKTVNNGEEYYSSQHFDQDFLQRNKSSPRKKNGYAQQSSRQAIMKTIKTELNKQTHVQGNLSSSGSESARIRQLIIDAISSADRAIKAFLPYGHAEVQKYCSIYFLNKQKLYSFLNNSHFSLKLQDTPTAHRKGKRKDELPSQLIEMVPLNHLERLEKIVYNKIMPILKVEFEAQKKKSERLMKKGKESNSDYKQGIKLLERLNQNQKVAIDQCAEILQKFIFRMMDRQQRMMGKLNKLQQKLDHQTKKNQQLLQESQEWYQHLQKIQKQRKILDKYQQFAKQVKEIFFKHRKINQESTQKEHLQEIVRQIRGIVEEAKIPPKDKKCEHKHKDIHGSCRQQQSRSSKQIKNLKEVIKNLNNDSAQLQAQYEDITSQLKNSNDLTRKIQLQYKKRSEQNLAMNAKIQQLMSEQSYKNRLIEEYLRIIDRLQQAIKSNEQTISRLNEENEGYLQLITKHSSEKEDYFKHIIELQQKEKELQEIIAKKDIEIEEVIANLESKQIEIVQLQTNNRNLAILLQEKEDIIVAHLEQSANLKDQLNPLNAYHPDPLIHQRAKEAAILKQALPPEQGELRQTNMSISSTKYKQLKALVKNLLQENGNLKFQIQRIKTFKAIEEYNETYQNRQLDAEEKHELKYLRNLILNYFSIAKNEEKNGNFPVNTVQKDNEDAELIIEQINKNQRQDFIPADINKQLIQTNEAENTQLHIDQDNNKTQTLDQAHKQITKYQEESPIHRLQNYISQIQNKPTQNKIKINEKPMEVSNQLQPSPIEVQPSKIQQLMDLSSRIGQNFIKLRQKFDCSLNLNQGLAQIQKQIDYMTSLLNIYKYNTLRKLQRIKKTELLQKYAQQEIQKLKKRLEEALIANQIQSTIQSNSQDSDFSLPEHLHSFFKQRNPFVNKHYFQSEAHRNIRTKPSKDFYTQTEVSERRKIPALSIESEVIIKETPLVSEVQDMRLINHIPKSFIDQLQAASPAINSQGLHLQTKQVSLEQPNPSILQSIQVQPKQEQGNSQFLTYQKLLQEQQKRIISQQLSNQGIKTPNRRPLQSSQYLNQILNAPQRKHQSDIEHSIHSFQAQPQQVKDMLMQRQQQLSHMLGEKDEEIQRLKAIIKTLTKTQEIEIKLSTPKTSRHQEYINKQLEILRNENENLWTLLIKEKSEIQHLRTLIQQYEHQPHKKQQNNQFSLFKYRPIGDNEAFVYDPTPAKNTLQRDMEIQLQNETKSLIIQPKEQRQLFVHSHHLHQSPQEDQRKISQSPKRFTRKTQKFERQNSPKHRSSKTSPGKTLKFDWQDLIPQYFGQRKAQQPHQDQK